jgi:hypothetical protein
MARKLQNRLALAHFKAKKGWEDLTLDIIEPKIDEELRRKRPSSSGDVLSDSSSSASDFQYSRGLLSSSPLKAPIFSDTINSSSSSSSHRKRTYHSSFQHPSSNSSSRKRYRFSPTAGRAIDASHTAWKDQHQLAQSSPIRPRKYSHFTTSAGPDISLFRGTSNLPGDNHTQNFMAGSDDEDDMLPMHSFKMTSMNMGSSPPRTPPPGRGRATSGRNNTFKNNNGKSGQEGADLLLYLATSPSPANPTGKSRMYPPSTPPPRNMALPSSMMTTPGGGGLMSGFGGPNTPSQAFDFADFVNITPSPAQNAWPKTPSTLKTPLTVARRRLTFENFLPPNGGPELVSPGIHGTAKQTGLGMQLGGDLIS